MNQTIVLYESKYGSTRQYAAWVAQALHCRAVALREAQFADIFLPQCLVFGGAVHANTIIGLRSLMARLAGKKGPCLIVFAVGITPWDEGNIWDLRIRNLAGYPDVPLHYCRGRFVMAAMTGVDRFICGVVNKINQKGSLAPHLAGRKEEMCKDYIAPIIQAAQQCEMEASDCRHTLHV